MICHRLEKSPIPAPVLLALSMALPACRSVPFEPVRRVPLAGIDTETARERVARSSPARFRVVSAVVFEVFGRRMPALGVAEVDRSAGSVRFSCVTHVGVKVFDVAARDGDAEFRSDLPRFGQRPGLGEALAGDVVAVYAAGVPGREASAEREADAITFTQPDGNGGRVEYVLAGEPCVLVEKRCHAGRRRVRTVNYYEYAERGDGALYPGAVVVRNHAHHYRLTLRTKRFSVAPDAVESEASP
jgi:hypothetical protein